MVDEDSESWYYCKLSVKFDEKENHYLVIDENHLVHLLVQFHLGNMAIFVLKEMAQHKNATITSGLAQYYFSPNISKLCQVK